MVLDLKNPFGLVQSQPQLNLPSTITPITPPVQKPATSNKNQQLGLMLYALGGALRGDKNFVENTMQLQNIQDAKKREKEMKENWQKALGNLEGSVNPTLVELARVVGPEKGAGLIASGLPQKQKREIREDISGRQRFVDTGEYVFKDVETPPKDLTEFQKAQKDYNKLMNIPVEGRSAEDLRNISILENKLFGQPRVISFFDNEGNVVPEESITSIDLALNPNILTEKADLGLSTVGQSPSITPKGAKSVMTLVRDDYLGAKSQIDTINDLASIIEENKDAFTFAGSLGNLVNSAKYQIQSAERLANLSKLQQNEKEFSDLDNMLDTKYGDILDKISQNRAVAKSIFLRLAYGTAKDIDPSGRLSDNDVKIAMDIIGNLGPNWKANLATLESLANRTQREYNDKYTTRINRVGDDDREEANKYKEIPTFLGGRDWRQTSAVAPTTTNVDALVNKYLQPQG